MAHLGTSLKNRTKSFVGFMVKFLFTLFLMVLALAGFGYWQYNENLKSVDAAGNGKSVEIMVPPGASTVQVAGLLEEQGLVRNALVMRAYSRISGLDGKIKAGRYSLETDMALPEIMDKLIQGSVEYITFTIPEGYNTKQIVETLEKKNLINKAVFMDLVANGSFDFDFLVGLPNDASRLEGYLFPDTYKITKETKEEEILTMMLARFNKEITDEFRQQAEKTGLTLHEAVTLASIVEREAKVDGERAKVAAVFLNRMKKNWKLESCATVQYALGEPKARLLKKDLQVKSPYNTYIHTGLPPGPIAAPGRASLQAAVNPADVDYMFFVVYQDGQHIFSKTLAEHNKAAARYIRETFGD